jgi:endonuclease/exonuclease/phosphatase family metal-dependent hydrolase
MTTQITVASYNIHKGFSALGQRLVLDEMRDRLRELGADIAFLQEVQGAHSRHAARHRHYPREPQHEYLFREAGMTAVYGCNASYAKGHHGNAIVSRYTVLQHDNIDISHHRLERRGMLHVILQLPTGRRMHAVCTHLGLFARSRRMQLEWIADAVRERIPADEPLVIAGDFNDWRRQASVVLHRELGLVEAFEAYGGKAARTFPAAFPLMALDRIYVRGVAVLGANSHAGGPWARLSDHAAVTATLAVL